jgi:hypothetical protein
MAPTPRERLHQVASHLPAQCAHNMGEAVAQPLLVRLKAFSRLGPSGGAHDCGRRGGSVCCQLDGGAGTRTSGGLGSGCDPAKRAFATHS